MNLSNISQIRCNGSDIVLGKLNGEVVYRKVNKEKEYAIEYTITARDTSDTVGSYYEYESKQYPYYLFKIYDSEGKASYTGYTSIEITKTNGTTTSDLTTSVSEVQKIKVWYPETTTQLSSGGYNQTYPSYITEILNSSNINTSNFVGLDFMFSYCTKLKSLDISSWDTSNVTTILAMCQYCSSLTSLNVSNLNTSSCTDLRNVFYYCTSIKTITGLDTWDTSNVTTMRSLFYYCSKLKNLDLSNWDTSSLTDTTYTFRYCDALSSINLSNWNTSGVTAMTKMFQRVSHKLDFNYDGTNYTNWTLTEINSGFFGLFPWRGDMSYVIYTYTVTAMGANLTSSMVTNYHLYLPRIYTSSSVHRRPTSSDVLIYQNDDTLTNNMSVGISNVEKIMVFYEKSKLYKFSFYGYNATYPCFVDSIIDSKDCFKNDTSYMFYNCSFLKNLDLSNWDTSSVTDMRYMFYRCTGLTSLDLSSWDTRSVTSSSSMLSSVSITLDWNYDGTNYQNWTLTESKAGYIGTFPWNQ